MEYNLKVNMNEYLPLRDVVFNTLRDAFKRGAGAWRAVDGDPVSGAAWRQPYPIREANRSWSWRDWF